MKFGDILRYPDDAGVGDSILYMFLSCDGSHNWVMSIRDPEAPWEPGHVLPAGISELIPYEEPSGIRVLVDGEDVTDKVEIRTIGPSAFDIGGLPPGDVTFEWRDTLA